MPKNTYNTVGKYYLSREFSGLVAKLHKALGIMNSSAALSYFKETDNPSLRHFYRLVNYNWGTQEEKLYKKAFKKFYDWFMKHKYAIYALREPKNGLPKHYLESKNKLVYILNIKERRMCDQKEVPMFA